MKDLFKKLHEDKELPKDLEKELMKSFDTLKLIADVTDLFTHKFGKSELDMHIEMDEALRTQLPPPDDQNDIEGDQGEIA